VRFQSLRSTWAAIILGFITAALLASCGGGGAATTTTGGTLFLLPGDANAYAGVPFEMQIVGGRSPYRLSSSDPGVFPVPDTMTSSSFTVLPANPGVVDVGLPPEALQVRTVNVIVRDSNGNAFTATIRVGQNFFTGYGIRITSSTCASTTNGATNIVCAGGDSVLRVVANFNGALYGNRQYRIDVLQGNFTLVNPDTGVSGQSVGFTTDHTGTATAIVRTLANIPSQVGVIKITDVATGTSTIETFPIQGAASNGQLTTIPSTFTFTGPDTVTCGSGQGTFFVFDGSPPYSAVSTAPGVQVNFIDPYHSPGVFGVTVGASGGATCPSGTIIVTDALNNRGTVTVTSAHGTTAPPAPITPLSVQPNAITLGCAQSGSVSVVGGTSSSSGGSGGSSTPSYSVSSANPNVTASVTGSTVTITRAGPAGAGTGGNTTSTVNVTDGTSVVGITVTAPLTCP
jgi:hypothetical protein